MAIYALRHWLAAAQDQYKRLFDKQKESGILIDRKYKVREAEKVTDLLFDISPEHYSKPETFERLNHYLADRRIAIADLSRRPEPQANDHLLRHLANETDEIPRLKIIEHLGRARYAPAGSTLAALRDDPAVAELDFRL